MPSFAEKLDDYFVRYLAYFNYRNYIDKIELQGNEKVLEFGCGGGNLSRFLVERLPKGKLVCIDNSEYWIDKSKKRLRDFENVEIKLEDILDFNEDILDFNFDAILIHCVLHDIAEKRGVINIMSRCLKDKGKIYLRELTRKSHGILREEIEELMALEGLKKLSSKEGYLLPIRGKVYEGVFIKGVKINVL